MQTVNHHLHVTNQGLQLLQHLRSFVFIERKTLFLCSLVIVRLLALNEVRVNPALR